MASQFPHPRPNEEAADGVTVVHFTGCNVSLDDETLGYVRDELVAIGEEPSHSPLFIDFGNVDFVSSMALGTLVNLHKKLLGAGRRLTIQNLSPQVHEVFAATRLDKLLDVRPIEPGAEPVIEGRQPRPPKGVLVVDDEQSILSVVEAGLQRAGYKVWLALRGHQAIELYHRHQEEIAVVLLDVLMPGMDGPHTLLALQELRPAVLCCFMTGNPGPYTQEALLQMGAVRVFRKPFAFAEVIETLSLLASWSSRRGKDRWIDIPQSSVNDAG